MEKINWIQELVHAESLIENEGLIESPEDLSPEQILLQDSVQYLILLKNEFQDAMTAFNELKGDVPGLVKMYGIAKTHSDFMLFRHGYKLVVSLKAPGIISLRVNFIPSSYVPASTNLATNAWLKHVMALLAKSTGCMTTFLSKSNIS
jgi:hypothetical protein